MIEGQSKTFTEKFFNQRTVPGGRSASFFRKLCSLIVLVVSFFLNHLNLYYPFRLLSKKF